MLNPSQAHSLSMQQHITREAWLLAAIELLRPLFAAKGFSVPACQVSCGFASTGTSIGHVGVRKAPRRDRPKAKCKHCGYQVPMLKKFLTYGPPICPKDKVEMEALGNWEEM